MGETGTKEPPRNISLLTMSLIAARSLTRSCLAARNVRPAALIGRVTQVRSIQVVPKMGTETEMKAEVIDQIRARIAYQKEVLAANPHKSHDEEWVELWTWIKISIYVCIPGCIFML